MGREDQGSEEREGKEYTRISVHEKRKKRSFFMLCL